ncbi:MAG: hypothetical protein N3D17_01615 [bacterium]|nr:hypothetical protein [bacterium]
MKIIYRNYNLKNPEVSIILIDWSVRHSFHILDYLNQQTVPRDRYEIIWIEYYSRIPEELMDKLNNSLKKGIPVLDQWIVMETPEDFCHHKHRMFNLGIVVSRGKIIVIPDSDAMVRSTFIESIIKTFNENDNIVLHIDEIRNKKRKFYPFNYPSIDEITSEGMVFRWDGKTPVSELSDPIHLLNYGACLCAKRDDLIDIGGADEHIDYLGHVCGVYDMTFRLKNAGKREIWHTEEFLYHTWHPGQGGSKIDHRGPNDGLEMSTTALSSIFNGRILALVENPAIKLLRTGITTNTDNLLAEFKPAEEWRADNIKKTPSFNSFLKKYQDCYFKINTLFWKFLFINSFMPAIKSLPRKIQGEINKNRKQILAESNLNKKSIYPVVPLIKKLYKAPQWFYFFLLRFFYSYNKNILENCLSLFYNNLKEETAVVVVGNKDLKKIIKYIAKKFKINIREIDKCETFNGKTIIAITPEVEVGSFDIPTVNWKRYEREVRKEISKLMNYGVKKENILIL